MKVAAAINELKNLGFKTWQTGGGCTALGLLLADNKEILVTDGEDGGGEPTKASTSLMVGLRDANTGEEIECKEREFDAAIAYVHELIRRYPFPVAAWPRI